MLWDLVKARRVDDLQQVGETILAGLDAAIQTVAVLAKNSVEPLAGVGAELEQIRREHLDTWPWFRQEDLDQARAEAARGETVEMDDAFAAIAGVSRAEWQRRVEAYQQRQRNREGS